MTCSPAWAMPSAGSWRAGLHVANQPGCSKAVGLIVVLEPIRAGDLNHRLGLGELLHHLRHVAAFLGAVAARLGTSGHLFVIGNFLAGGCTVVTTLGTTLRRYGGEITLSCAQRRAHFAALRAVHAEMHALGMFLFPLAHERCAVMEARIARHLAIRANACTLQHVGGVWTVGRERGRVHNE